jgi:hypothetical protein
LCRESIRASKEAQGIDGFFEQAIIAVRLLMRYGSHYGARSQIRDPTPSLDRISDCVALQDRIIIQPISPVGHKFERSNLTVKGEEGG